MAEESLHSIKLLPVRYDDIQPYRGFCCKLDQNPEARDKEGDMFASSVKRYWCVYVHAFSRATIVHSGMFTTV